MSSSAKWSNVLLQVPACSMERLWLYDPVSAKMIMMMISIFTNDKLKMQ